MAGRKKKQNKQINPARPQLGITLKFLSIYDVSVQCRSNRRWVLGQGPDSRCVILDVAWRRTAGTRTFCFARPSGAHRLGPGSEDVMRCLVLLTFHVGHCEYQEEVYIHMCICIYIYIWQRAICPARTRRSYAPRGCILLRGHGGSMEGTLIICHVE